MSFMADYADLPKTDHHNAVSADRVPSLIYGVGLLDEAAQERGLTAIFAKAPQTICGPGLNLNGRTCRVARLRNPVNRGSIVRY